MPLPKLFSVYTRPYCPNLPSQLGWNWCGLHTDSIEVSAQLALRFLRQGLEVAVHDGFIFHLAKLPEGK